MRPATRLTHGLLACFGVLSLIACGGASPPAPRAAASLTDVLGGDAAGFARAVEVRPLQFPRDHGPHPSFRNEWWYLTGNLSTDDGRPFGYQLTLFRSALAPPTPAAGPRASAWATEQIYMAHFAVGDVQGGRLFPFDRFSRGAIGLAGAQLSPFKVWLEDWSIEFAADGAAPPRATTTAPPRATTAAAPSPAVADGRVGLLPLRLRARQDNVAIDVMLTSGKPIVLHGERGLSRKGSAPGNASYYYSLTRIETAGTVTVDGTGHTVRGNSWLDREWSSNALEPGQVGWDWFSLQLGDNTELMLYLMRRADGVVDLASSGTFVGADGGAEHLSVADISVEVLDTWRSPRTGVTYPAHWLLAIPALGIRLQVRPRIADQELDLAFRYWEGAVEASGSREGRPLQGLGFVELTGY